MLVVSSDALKAPQDDGSDTAALMHLALQRWPLGPLYDSPYHMLDITLEAGDPYFSRGDGLSPAPLDHPNLPAVAAALTAWPKARKVISLLTSFTPLLAEVQGRGCMSGHNHPRSSEGRINVFVSINDPTGAAEGIVHEIAHQRLHILGVDLESHDGLLLDAEPTPAPRFFSPIRRDVPRPITALLHGIYAWTFMLEIDLANADGAEYLTWNLPKVRLGLQTLQEGALWTTRGLEFWTEFENWAADCIRRSEQRLESLGLKEVPVPGKEW